MKKKSNVLVYPGWSDTPYLKVLYKGFQNTVYAKYSGAIFSITRNTLSERAAIIHIHWTSSLFYNNERQNFKTLLKKSISILDLLFVKFVLNKKIIWTVHNLYPHDCMNKKSERKCRKILGKLSTSVIVLGRSAISVVSNEFGIPEEKISVQLHGTFNMLFDGFIALDRSEVLTKFGLPESENKIYLFPGTVKSYKNPLGAIQAFNRENSNSILLIAGKVDKDLKDKLSESATVKIIDRYLEDEEFFQLYKIADWVVIPYSQILTSGSVLTAIGLGKAIIAPNMGTIPDYLDELGGILFDPSDKNGFSLSVEESSKRNASEMGKHNYQKGLNFDWIETRKDLHDIINRLLDGR